MLLVGRSDAGVAGLFRGSVRRELDLVITTRNNLLSRKYTIENFDPATRPDSCMNGTFLKDFPIANEHEEISKIAEQCILGHS